MASVILAILRKSILLACVIMFADAVGVTVGSIMLKLNLFHYYALIMLGQAGLLFLVGGGLDVGRSLGFARIAHRVNRTKSWTFSEHKQAQQRAAPYIVTGILLLALSFILAYPLN
ncbi:MAG: hypothetical protein WB643_11330 [Candidatus Bathyarchaeia archaeon]